DVEPQPRGSAEDRCITHRDGCEIVASELEETFFSPDLRFGVRCERTQGRGLSELRVRSGGAIHRARRSEHEAADSGFTCRACQNERPVAVDVFCEVWMEIPERVVRQGGEVDDRIKAPQVGRSYIAHVGNSAAHGTQVCAEIAASKELSIEASHVVAGGSKVRRQNRPNVAMVTRDENFHPRRTVMT